MSFHGYRAARRGLRATGADMSTPAPPLVGDTELESLNTANNRSGIGWLIAGLIIGIPVTFIAGMYLLVLWKRQRKRRAMELLKGSSVGVTVSQTSSSTVPTSTQLDAPTWCIAEQSRSGFLEADMS